MQDNNTDKAFTALVQQYERLLYKVCCMYTTTTEDRQDLFQEIVLQVWRSYPKYEPAAKVSTWLYRIALNTSISHKRKQGRTIITQEGGDWLHHIEDRMTDSYAEEYKMLYKMIGDLPALEKALVLLYLEDRSYQEIAEILGISASNVGTRLNRVKEKLRKQVSPLRPLKGELERTFN